MNLYFMNLRYLIGRIILKGNSAESKLDGLVLPVDLHVGHVLLLGASRRVHLDEPLGGGG